MNVAIHVAKNVLHPLGITAAASAIDVGIQNKTKNKQTWLWEDYVNNFKWRNE